MFRCNCFALPCVYDPLFMYMYMYTYMYIYNVHSVSRDKDPVIETRQCKRYACTMYMYTCFCFAGPCLYLCFCTCTHTYTCTCKYTVSHRDKVMLYLRQLLCTCRCTHSRQLWCAMANFCSMFLYWHLYVNALPVASSCSEDKREELVPH